MTTKEIQLHRSDETFDVEITLDNGENIVSLMEDVVKNGTDLPPEAVPLLSMEQLAELYSAVVEEMNT